MRLDRSIGRHAPSRGTSSVGRFEAGLVAVVFLVAILTRAMNVRHPIMWDEATTLFNHVLVPFKETISWYPEPNNHVFSSALAHVAVAILGPTLPGFRLPTLLAGIGVVMLGWFVARRDGGPAAGFLAAGVLALSPILVVWSIAARPIAGRRARPGRRQPLPIVWSSSHWRLNGYLGGRRWNASSGRRGSMGAPERGPTPCTGRTACTPWP